MSDRLIDSFQDYVQKVQQGGNSPNEHQQSWILVYTVYRGSRISSSKSSKEGTLLMNISTLN